MPSFVGIRTSRNGCFSSANFNIILFCDIFLRMKKQIHLSLVFNLFLIFSVINVSYYTNFSRFTNFENKIHESNSVCETQHAVPFIHVSNQKNNNSFKLNNTDVKSNIDLLVAFKKINFHAKTYICTNVLQSITLNKFLSQLILFSTVF